MPAPALRRALEDFLEGCHQPALLEPSQPPLAWIHDNTRLTDRPNGLLVELWDDTRSWARRLVSVEPSVEGRLTLWAERLGGERLKLELVDLARPASESRVRRNRRETLAERLKLWIGARYPGWRIDVLSAGSDLAHTLSPSYARALLVRGQQRVAVLAAPNEAATAHSALTYALIWLDHLRRREAPAPVAELVLFVPEHAVQATLLRLKWLDSKQARYTLYSYDSEEREHAVDAADTGNIDSHVEPCRLDPSTMLPAALLNELRAIAGFHAVDVAPGVISLRIHGLAFARLDNGHLRCGIERQRTVHSIQPVVTLARRLAAVRNGDARTNAVERGLRARYPEAWLESVVRHNLPALDASLCAEPVYGQVPSMTGTQHGLMDLLAIDRNARLAVIELKASEDPDLPLQALDYWIRVEHHARTGAFTEKGYFPGTALAAQPPRLLLVAPALEFHPTTEAVLRFFSPRIDVERLGVALDWRRALKVVMHLRGAERPGLRMAASSVGPNAR